MTTCHRTTTNMEVGGILMNSAFTYTYSCA
jgi:hypothetical protein